MRRADVQDSVNTHVGRKIRLRRWMASMTQGELGQAVGVGLQQIHKYESGVSQIGASRLWRIAVALGCDVSYFFEGLEGRAAPGSFLAAGPQPQLPDSLANGDVL